VSHYARLAEELAQHISFLPPFLPFVVTESHWFGGKCGAIDLSIPIQTPWGLRWLHVEIDGETHSTKAWQGQTLGQQRLRDGKKDAEAWRGECMLVRLHFYDLRPNLPDYTKVWRETLAYAAQLAMLERKQRFIIYTPSYKALGKQSCVEALAS
jgi:hypothetical protein